MPGGVEAAGGRVGGTVATPKPQCTDDGSTGCHVP